MHHADVVELVDTLDSGSSAREGMKVQVLSSALKNPVVRCRVFLLGWPPKPADAGGASFSEGESIISAFPEGFSRMLHFFVRSK